MMLHASPTSTAPRTTNYGNCFASKGNPRRKPEAHQNQRKSASTDDGNVSSSSSQTKNKKSKNAKIEGLSEGSGIWWRYNEGWVSAEILRALGDGYYDIKIVDPKIVKGLGRDSVFGIEGSRLRAKNEEQQNGATRGGEESFSTIGESSHGDQAALLKDSKGGNGNEDIIRDDFLTFPTALALSPLGLIPHPSKISLLSPSCKPSPGLSVSTPGQRPGQLPEDLTSWNTSNDNDTSPSVPPFSTALKHFYQKEEERKVDPVFLLRELQRTVEQGPRGKLQRDSYSRRNRNQGPIVSPSSFLNLNSGGGRSTHERLIDHPVPSAFNGISSNKDTRTRKNVHQNKRASKRSRS
eukprot:jgi/Bigna1/69602/fgenesh1_pg.9_\